MNRTADLTDFSGWERIKRGVLLVLALVLGLIGGVGAQVGPGSLVGAARIFAVEEAGFSLPQVQLPDAVAARRINRRLRQVLLTAPIMADRSDEQPAPDSMAPVRRQLRQRYRGCCYDAETKMWKVGQGYTGLEYKVLLNQHGLLSLGANLEFTNRHHDYESRYLTFDLKTGRQLTLTDVLAEPLPRLRRRMQGAINRRYQEQALEVKATYAAPEDTARQHDYLRLLSWNEATRHVDLGWPAADDPDAPSLQIFALTAEALLLIYDREAGFGYINQGEEPSTIYRFPYRGLQVRPCLAWTRPAKPAPKKAAPANRPKR